MRSGRQEQNTTWWGTTGHSGCFDVLFMCYEIRWKARWWHAGWAKGELVCINGAPPWREKRRRKVARVTTGPADGCEKKSLLTYFWFREGARPCFGRRRRRAGEWVRNRGGCLDERRGRKRGRARDSTGCSRWRKMFTSHFTRNPRTIKWEATWVRGTVGPCDEMEIWRLFFFLKVF